MPSVSVVFTCDFHVTIMAHSAPWLVHVVVLKAVITHKQQAQQTQPQQGQGSVHAQEQTGQDGEQQQQQEQRDEQQQEQAVDAEASVNVPSLPSLLELSSALLLECVRASESAADLVVESDSIRWGSKGAWAIVWQRQSTTIRVAALVHGP